jgi:hypothetical protein
MHNMTLSRLAGRYWSLEGLRLPAVPPVPLLEGAGVTEAEVFDLEVRLEIGVIGNEFDSQICTLVSGTDVSSSRSVDGSRSPQSADEALLEIL